MKSKGFNRKITILLAITLISTVITWPVYSEIISTTTAYQKPGIVTGGVANAGYLIDDDMSTSVVFSSTSDTATFSSFGFNIPADATIKDVYVQMTAVRAGTNVNGFLTVEITNNPAGTTWRNDEIIFGTSQVTKPIIFSFAQGFSAADFDSNFKIRFVGSPNAPRALRVFDVQVLITYSRDLYTVTWWNEGGIVLETDTDAPYGMMPSYDDLTPTKAATAEYTYTFYDWDPTLTAVTVNADYTAMYTQTSNEYTISFDSNGGSDVDSIIQEYGTDVIAPNDPVQDGYTFDGWYPEVPVTMPAEDTECVAQWTANEYTISFDSNGGSDVDPIIQDCGTAVTAPDDPVQAGFTFDGWLPAVPDIMPVDGEFCVAQWTINQYTITFDSNGGSDVDSIIQDYGIDVTVPDDPVQEGYTFDGWSPEVPATMPAEDTECVAQWTINEYTITFESNGGSDVYPILQDYGTAVTAPDAPVQEGYTFDVWSPEVPVTMPAEDTECVAQWTINQYTITFDSAGGSDVDPILQDYGTAVTAPEDPVREGYTFDGWLPTVPATMPEDGETCVAQWATNQYTITFDSAGGSDVDPILQDYGTDVTVPEAPVQAGYTFNGWSPVVPVTMPAEDTECVAQWTANEYTISFDSNGGSAVDPITQDYNTAVTTPDAPVQAGYTFNGWLPAVPATMPVDGETCVAQWTINQYTITFDSAGGSDVDPILQDYGSGVIAPDAPVQEGYTFDGWSPEVPVTMPAEDTECVAQWTANEYTISFDSNGGSDVEPITQGYDSAVIAPEDPYRVGYTFTGWLPVVPAAMPIDGEACVAQWTINQYTVRFDVNGGSDVDPITQDYDSAVTPPEDPTREGYTFAGWLLTVPETMPAGGGTCVAQWTANEYTIAFDSNGGSAVASVTQDYDSAVTAPDAPTREGYTFAGWLPAVPAVMPVDGGTCVAQWTINQYTIAFDSNGGSAVASVTQDYGTAVTTPAAPARTGYTFKGWLPAVPGTMPAENITCAAQWDVKNISTAVYYRNETVNSLGLYFRDYNPDLTVGNEMFTPLDISADGEQIIPLIASNAYRIGEVRILVNQGYLTVTYTLLPGVTLKSEFFTIFSELAVVTTIDPEELAGLSMRFDEPVNIEESFSGDTRILMYINNIVDYSDEVNGLSTFNDQQSDTAAMRETQKENMD